MINTSKAKIDHTRKNGLLHFRFDGVKNGCLDELELFLAARATYFSQSKYIGLYLLLFKSCAPFLINLPSN